MAKQTGAISTPFIVGGIGVVASSIAYLQPPVLYLGWSVGLFLSIGCPLGIFYWSQRQVMKSEDKVEGLSEEEVDEIMDSPPTLKDFKLEFEGGSLTRHRLLVSFTIKNNRDILLELMEVSLEVTDMERNKSWTKDYPIPALGQRESEDHLFKVAVGWRLSKKYKVVFVIYSFGIEVARRHFILEKGLFDRFRVSS